MKDWLYTCIFLKGLMNWDLSVKNSVGKNKTKN